jgi:hypothetical protein
VLVDNSQGHSFYADDALRVSSMNMKPGGKQSRLRNGWYIDANGTMTTQAMIFPLDHPKYPDQPKGMREVLTERGLWRRNLLMTCHSQCVAEATNCCAKRILELQPDFLAQKLRVQEIIEAAGMLLHRVSA